LATASLLNYIYSQGILQDVLSLWVRAMLSDPSQLPRREVWPGIWNLAIILVIDLNLIFVHLNHKRSFQEQEYNIKKIFSQGSV